MSSQAIHESEDLTSITHSEQEPAIQVISESPRLAEKINLLAWIRKQDDPQLWQHLQQLRQSWELEQKLPSLPKYATSRFTENDRAEGVQDGAYESLHALRSRMPI